MLDCLRDLRVRKDRREEPSCLGGCFWDLCDISSLYRFFYSKFVVELLMLILFMSFYPEGILCCLSVGNLGFLLLVFGISITLVCMSLLVKLVSIVSVFYSNFLTVCFNRVFSSVLGSLGLSANILTGFTWEGRTFCCLACLLRYLALLICPLVAVCGLMIVVWFGNPFTPF